MRKDAARWDSQQSNFWFSHFMQRRMSVYSCPFYPHQFSLKACSTWSVWQFVRRVQVD